MFDPLPEAAILTIEYKIAAAEMDYVICCQMDQLPPTLANPVSNRRLRTARMQTLPVLIYLLRGETRTPFGMLMSSGLLATWNEGSMLSVKVLKLVPHPCVL